MNSVKYNFDLMRSEQRDIIIREARELLSKVLIPQPSFKNKVKEDKPTV